MRRRVTHLPLDGQQFGVRVGRRKPRNNTHDFVINPSEEIRPRWQGAAVRRSVKRRGHRRRHLEPCRGRADVVQDYRASRSDRLPTHFVIRNRCEPAIAHVAQSRHQPRIEVHRRTNHQIIAGPTIDAISSVAADQHIGPRSAQQRVVAESPQHQIVAVATIEPILANAAEHRVIAGSAHHVVVAIADSHAVVAVARVDPFAERTAQDAVVTIKRVDDHAEVARCREVLCIVERRRHGPLFADRRSLLQSKAARHTGQIHHVRTLVPHDHDPRDQRRRQIREDLL